MQLLKPSKSWLCSSVHLLQIVVWYFTATGLYITLHSSSARLRVDGIHPVQIHLIGIRDWLLITAVSIIKRLSLYKFTLEPRFSVHCLYQRESVLWRVFFKKLYENFVAALETVRYREVSVPRGSTVIRKNLN